MAVYTVELVNGPYDGERGRYKMLSSSCYIYKAPIHSPVCSKNGGFTYIYERSHIGDSGVIYFKYKGVRHD